MIESKLSKKWVLWINLCLVIGCVVETPEEHNCLNEGRGSPNCMNDSSISYPDTDGGMGWSLGYEQFSQGEEVEQIGVCGAFATGIVWQMPGGAPEDGAIVQHMVVEYTHYLASYDHVMECLDGFNSTSEYWELWPIEAGDRSPDGSLYFDFFSSGMSDSPDGTIKWTGIASYYSDSEIGAEYDLFEEDNVEEAGDLRATHTQPSFWDTNRNSLKRIQQITWNCCPDNESTIIDCGYWLADNQCK